jgi:polysaccharide pyruvyl transferase CsaB
MGGGLQRFGAMTASEKLSKRETPALKRNLVVVSGYYGYDNLGDEAILEQIIGELAGLCAREEIVVLSNDPEKTVRLYGTKAVNRWQLLPLTTTLRSTRLFISGGGGLFQDTRNLNSVLFYGGQIMLARQAGTKIMIYAQGLGPLKNPLSRLLTQKFFKLADSITVRDEKSQRLLQSWSIDAEKTADPVWRLEKTPLPEGFDSQLKRGGGNQDDGAPLVGLSLRPSSQLTGENLKQLADILKNNLPGRAKLILLPFKADSDQPVLDAFAQSCQKNDLACQFIDTTDLARPSQWLSLMEKFDFVIGMRLHALVMALKAGKPVIGIPYDPKVSDILSVFGQPVFNLESRPADWAQILSQSLTRLPELAQLARSNASLMENSACKNFELLAKIFRS